MGDLIVLPRTERQPHQMPTPEYSAEILFFTGVRYYRMTEETPSPVAEPRRRRRRTSGNRTDVVSRIDRQA